MVRPEPISSYKHNINVYETGKNCAIQFSQVRMTWFQYIYIYSRSICYMVQNSIFLLLKFLPYCLSRKLCEIPHYGNILVNLPLKFSQICFTYFEAKLLDTEIRWKFIILPFREIKVLSKYHVTKGRF